MDYWNKWKNDERRIFEIGIYELLKSKESINMVFEIIDILIVTESQRIYTQISLKIIDKCCLKRDEKVGRSALPRRTSSGKSRSVKISYV
jgi:hypothetical protein